MLVLGATGALLQQVFLLQQQQAQPSWDVPLLCHMGPLRADLPMGSPMQGAKAMGMEGLLRQMASLLCSQEAQQQQRYEVVEARAQALRAQVNQLETRAEAAEARAQALQAQANQLETRAEAAGARVRALQAQAKQQGEQNQTRAVKQPCKLDFIGRCLKLLESWAASLAAARSLASVPS